MKKVISNPEEFEDVDSRIVSRSIKHKHSISTYETCNAFLMLLDPQIRFLKSMEGITLREAFKRAEGTNVIEKRYGQESMTWSYKTELLEHIAEQFLKEKMYIKIIENSKEGEPYIRLTLVPTNVKRSSKKGRKTSLEIEKYTFAKIPFSRSGHKDESIQLEKALIRELGKPKWDKIMKMKAGTGLLRKSSIKSWPIMRDAIFDLYTLLLPIYPSTARKQINKKLEGEKTTYPFTLIRDLVDILKERFPKELKDLTFDDVLSSIQYRLKKRQKIP